MNFQNKKLEGIVYTLIACVTFPLMTAIVRYLSKMGMDGVEIVFWRNMTALTLLVPFVFFKRSGISIRINNKTLYFARVIFGLASMTLWFYGLGMLDLATSTALTFSAPIFTSIMAVVLLKEKMGTRRWSAVFIGFIGMLIIVRPGISELHGGALFIVSGCFFMSIALIIVKKLTDTETPFSMMFHMHLWFAVLTLPFAYRYWHGMDANKLFWCYGVAVFSIIAQYSVAKSYSLIDVTVTTPFDFLRLIIATIVAYYAFGEVPDKWTYLGGAIIISSTIYIAHREMMRKRRGEEV
jgi:drug/metabolite transporter (DMT)-like permease